MSLFFFFVAAGVLFGVFYVLEVRGHHDEWGRWFAWRPVKLKDGTRAWWCWVERDYAAGMVGGGEPGWWVYRRPKGTGEGE